MQYSTFAAIDIGSYDVILEIFEISKKQGIRSVDKICHRMELGKDTYTLCLLYTSPSPRDTR